MINRSSWKGAITVYLSIILSSVILLSGVLMDIVRIKAAEVQVRRAVNTAAASALAGYHTKLKEDYGLFALHNNDSSQVEQIVRSYLKKNLLIESGENSGGERVYDFIKSIVINDEYRNVNFIDIYDYNIESVQVVPIYNFTENEIIRQQITEYMKYRAPAQFAENFMEKVKNVSSTAEVTDAYKQKTIIEKKLLKVEKALKRLQKELDALNQFNKDNFDNRQGSGSLVKAYIEFVVQQSVYSVYGSVEILVTGDKKDKEKAEKIRQYTAELYENAEANARETYKQLKGHISDCLAAAQNALREMHSIEALINSVRSDINALKSSLKKMDNDNQKDMLQVTAALKQDIVKWEQFIDSGNSSGILPQLEKDIEILNDINSNLTAIPNLASSQSGSLRTDAADNLRNALKAAGSLDISGTSKFNNIVGRILSASEVSNMFNSAEDFVAIKAVTVKGDGKRGKDPRKTIADNAKKVIGEVADAAKGTKRIEAPKLLPSYHINGNYPNKIFSEALLQSTEGEEGLSEGINVDFEEESSFSEDTFGYITDLATKLKQYVVNMRDEIYVNEYILATFKDEVEIKGASTDYKTRDTLFDKAEVEYILGGAPGETQNSVIVKGEILLIRFGMDTLHVYSDSEKRMLALEIATAAAGFTGFGIPVVHNLIMCAWGMAEAFQDIKDLYAGKRVPFMKNAQNWRTDLVPGGYSVTEDEQHQGSLMDFDYHDYLRLLLLVQNKEVKMNRIEDLIQLNMQKSDSKFKLSGYNTYVKVNVQVSIKYWFMTRIFVPSKLKTPDGRHLINIEAWKGY